MFRQEAHHGMTRDKDENFLNNSTFFTVNVTKMECDHFRSHSVNFVLALKLGSQVRNSKKAH